MGILTFLSRRLGLTPNEGRVVLFLVAGLAAGGLIRLYVAYVGTGSNFDYRVQDSIFTARSARALQDTVPGEYDLPSQPESIININTAGIDELVQLPGVGDSLAFRILAYRKEHGPFKTAEDIMNIRGIGEKKFEQIAPHISMHN